MLTYQTDIYNAPEDGEDRGSKDKVVSDAHFEMTSRRKTGVLRSWVYYWLRVFRTHLKFIIIFFTKTFNLKVDKVLN